MNTKLFEIRDHVTLIPVIAMQLGGRDAKEEWLLGRAGFGRTRARQAEYIIVSVPGDAGRSTSDPYGWSTESMREGHLYIQEHWDELDSGALIDIEFILGRQATPKTSEFLMEQR